MIDPAHDLGGDQRAGIDPWKRVVSRAVERVSASGLMRHQAHELGVATPRLQIVRGDAERPEVVLRDVDTAATGIGADVADDIRQLERDAEVHRVVTSVAVGITEDLNGCQPHGGGDAIAVGIEVVGGLVADARHVHGDAIDDRLQRLARNPELLHGRRQALGDRMLGPRSRLVAAGDLAPPALELLAQHAGIGALFGPEVGNVVDGPAERIHGVEGVAAGPGQREEGVVEVRAASPGQPRDQVGAGHDAAIFTAGATRV